MCFEYQRSKRQNVTRHPLPSVDGCVHWLYRGSSRLLNTSHHLGLLAGSHCRRRQKWDHTYMQPGTYWFNRMAFGLINPPATVLRYLDISLDRFAWHTYFLEIDRIIIFSNQYQFHSKNIDSALYTLLKTAVSLQMEKWKWFTTTAQYLRNEIRPSRLWINDSHKKWLRLKQHPGTHTELSFFFGLRNVHKRFLAHFAHTAAPLRSVQKKRQPAHLAPFNKRKSTTFGRRKEDVLAALSLTLLKQGLVSFVNIDLSDEQIDAVIFQLTIPKGCP